MKVAIYALFSLFVVAGTYGTVLYEIPGINLPGWRLWMASAPSGIEGILCEEGIIERRLGSPSSFLKDVEADGCRIELWWNPLATLSNIIIFLVIGEIAWMFGERIFMRQWTIVKEWILKRVAQKV